MPAIEPYHPPEYHELEEPFHGHPYHDSHGSNISSSDFVGLIVIMLAIALAAGIIGQIFKYSIIGIIKLTAYIKRILNE